MSATPRLRSARRGPRGHLLVEALVSSTVLLVAVSAILGAVGGAERTIALAGVDQRAWHELRQRYEIQRASSLSSPDWVVGTRTGTITPHLDSVPWTWTVVVSQVTDAAVAGVSPLRYRKAVVRLAYRGKTIELEALKW